MSNTIDSKLQLTEVLGSALEAFKRATLPLRAFAHSFQNLQLQGTDKMVVPYYPLATSASQDFAGSYKALATNTATEAREVTVNKRKVQAISFTSSERARQPKFDPVKHGQLKGEKLAFDVLADIMSPIKLSNFNGSTLAAMASTAFDEGDVADLAQKCAEDNWPKMGRSLILNPAFWFAVARRPIIIQADQHGSTRGQTDADFQNLLGFECYGSNGVPTNTGTAFAITGVAATDLITKVAHGLQAGDRVVFPALTGGSGLTAGTTEYYVIASGLTADDFKVSATLGGAAVNFTTDISAGTCKTYENIAGFACLPGALLVAGAPIAPTEGVRHVLVDYHVEKDDDSDLAIEFRHFGDPDTDTSYQTIEFNYGYAVGDSACLKRLYTA